MKKLVLVFGIALLFSTTAMAVEIAISTQSGWWGQGAADRETQVIADSVTGAPVELFPAADQAALATWVEDHTGDGVEDLLIICGQLPDTIYEPGNTQADDSIIELFLDDGNTIINTGDWIFYVVNGAGTNGPGGLQTIMDIPGVTVAGGNDTAVVVTAEGQEFTPSLQGFATDRPFHLDTLDGDWEVELVLAQDAGGTLADPVIVRNSETGGRIGVFYQTAGQDNDPRGQVISEWINNWYLKNAADPKLAKKPIPDDGTMDIPRDTDLNWAAGKFAATHDVYIGTSFDDVTDATTPVSAGQTDTTFDPGRLEFGQTYFWRVDEVNSAPDRTVFKGDVWSFEVEPVGYPITNVTATASSSNADTMGPENTVNGSGLNELDQHSSLATDMWLSAPGDANPWIQYEFDVALKLHQLMVWNQNQLIEAFVGLGAKDVVIETSLDGAEWVVLEGATQFNQATGADTYTANTTIDFGGIMAKFVKITVNASWGGVMPNSGISEVRFSFIPTFAREPQPADGATTDGVGVVVGWRAGREAVSHEVYLGTDSTDLPLLSTVSDNSLDLSNQGLAYATTYFWKVNEVNDAGTPTSYDGPVWSFTTPDFGTVDDFDQYNDKCNRIFFDWEDGLGHNGGEEVEDCDEPASNGNGGGSIVGNDQAPFAEKTIVNAGSKQSMPFGYDNSFGDSFATLSIGGQDWTASGVQTLSLAFRGTAGNTGTLYIKINNTKILYDLNPTDIATEAWLAWNIDLTGVSGLQNVSSFTIGVDGASAAGMLYIDDIRLYPLQGELVTPVAPSDDGLVAYYSFEGNANDMSGNGHNGTLEGNAQIVAGHTGSALDCDGFDGYVSTGKSASQLGIDGNKARTVTCWINLRSFNNGAIFDVGNRSNGEDFSLRTLGSAGDWRVQYWGGAFDIDFQLDALDKWVHITHVYDGGATQIYADGFLVSSGPGVLDTKDNNPWQIGRYGWPDAYWDGMIDELRLYNRALTAEEALGATGRTSPVHKAL